MIVTGTAAETALRNHGMNGESDDVMESRCEHEYERMQKELWLQNSCSECAENAA